MISRRTDVIKRCTTTSLYPVASRKKTNPFKPGESYTAAYVIAFRPGEVGGHAQLCLVLYREIGRECGVGRVLGVGAGLGVGVGRGVGVGLAVGVPVGVAVGVAVGLTVGVGVGVALGEAVGVGDGGGPPGKAKA
jgi:hypothetical protein